MEIEIGWIIAGRMEDVDYQACREARTQVLNLLNSRFSEFSWRIPAVRRPELVSGLREEPVVLLDHGSEEREAHRWDFALLITAVDLISHYKPFALATISRAVDLAVISTARIDPFAVDADRPRDERVQVMAGRIAALALHALGHLNGLTHSEDPDNLMFDVSTVSDLDQLTAWDESQIQSMRTSLQETADLRLEEQPRRPSRIGFYLTSIRINRRDIMNAVREARPWQFPARLSRLTTAAVSALLVLTMTGETWDLAVGQSPLMVAGLNVIALIATTAYVVRRQQLLVRRVQGRLTEQIVTTNVSTVAIVLSGMLTLLLLLFGTVLLISGLLFRPSLVNEWTVSLQEPVSAIHYVLMAAFVASLGILIGALGASFEEQHHFRHITFVDEET